MELIALLSRRLQWFHDAIQEAFEPNGLPPITRAQSYVLATILSGVHKASDIARSLGVSRQAISLILADLESLGLIEIAVDPSDRRAKLANISPRHVETGTLCLQIFEELENELLERIGQRRLANLHDALNAEWGIPPKIRVDTVQSGGKLQKA